MKWRSRLAVVCAKLADRMIRKVNRGGGSTFPGYVARLVDPEILPVLAGMVRQKIIAVTGTNGKTTTNHILCHVLEANGWKVISNRRGANMVNGIVTAFVLAVGQGGRLDADYACIEVDEFAAEEVLGKLKPHCVAVTNLSRDQLDRFGEIDIVLDRLQKSFIAVPDAVLVLNCDDAVSWQLASGSRNPLVSCGISQYFAGENSWGRSQESAFCHVCGSLLEYEFVHFGHLGIWRCPKCGTRRPEPDYSAENIRLWKGSYSFQLKSALSEAYPFPAGDMCGEFRKMPYNAKQADDHTKMSARGLYSGINCEYGIKEDETKDINSGVFFPYNIYNVLTAYGVLDAMGVSRGFGKAMETFDYGNGRESSFVVKGGCVQLHLAKNPAGFQQKLSFLSRDPKPKDVILLINDAEEDGTDISWLWDVDFQCLGNVNARKIIACGSRRYDLGLRLKYEDISWSFTRDIRYTVEKISENGTGNLYVIVNYSGLYRMNHMLEELEKGVQKHETDHRAFIPKSAQLVR